MVARPRTTGVRAAVVAVVASTSLLLTGTAAVASAAMQRPSAAVAPRAASTFSPLKRGDRGAQVRTLQYALKKRGFRVAVNGRFGPLTHAAVRQFQRKKRLPVTGTVGVRTWKALGLKVPAPAPVATTTTTTLPVGTYRHPSAAVERWHSVALQVGWAEKDWKHLSCIIQRESKGNPNAKNASTAMGLMQILYRVHRVWVGPDPTILLDPATNLRFALKMFKGRGWKPWSSTNHLCDN